MATRIKICGITRPEDARAAVAAGADAVGFVFAPTPRLVSAEQARALAAEIPPFVATVGLFVDPDPEYVRAVLKRVPLSLLQFHGDETPEQCRAYGRPYIKGIRMRDDVNLPAEERRFDDAVALLLDAFVPDELGGAGRSFDWSRIPEARAKPIVLAGGLTAETVGAAIRRVRPAAVDVSSGVETAKGIKDAGRIVAFVRAVREAQ
jgi:phosphoribosylanthranilate isomerase